MCIVLVFVLSACVLHFVLFFPRSTLLDSGGSKRALRESRLDVVNGQYSMLLAIHRLSKEAKGFLDLALFLRRHVVLLGELRLSRLGRAAAAGCAACFALGRLKLRISSDFVFHVPVTQRVIPWRIRIVGETKRFVLRWLIQPVSEQLTDVTDLGKRGAPATVRILQYDTIIMTVHIHSCKIPASYKITDFLTTQLHSSHQQPTKLKNVKRGAAGIHLKDIIRSCKAHQGLY